MHRNKNTAKTLLTFILPIVLFFILVFANSSAFSQETDKFAQQFQYSENFDNNYSYNPQGKEQSEEHYNRGVEYLNAGQYSKAITEFELSLNISPDRENSKINIAVAYINRGNFYFNKTKEYLKARNDYRNAIYYLKYNSFSQNKDISSQNLGIAKANLDNIIKVSNISSSKSSRLQMAKDLRGQGQFRESIVEFGESLEGNKNDYSSLVAMADLLSALENDEKAVEIYKKALVYKKSIPLRLKYAKALNNSGDSENAVKEYNSIINSAKNEEKQEIFDALEAIWVKKLQQNPQDASAHMNLGVVLQKKGDLEGALKEYQFAESISPNDITIRLNMGTLYHAMKDYDMAINAYDTILSVLPENLIARYYKGTALRDAGRLDEAIKEFQSILSKEPNNAAVKEAFFQTIKLFPNTAETDYIFKTVAENNPYDAFAQLKYAIHLHSGQKLDSALVYYNKTVALDPTLGDSYLNMASIYKQQNKLSSAISILEKGLKAIPKNEKISSMLNSIRAESVNTRYQSALKKHNEGKYEEAIKEYLSIIQVSEPDSDIYYNLGAAYQAAKKYAEATSAYKKSTELDPTNTNTFYYLGIVYDLQGKYKEAISAYKKALILSPEDENIKKAIDKSQKLVQTGAVQKGIDLYNNGKYNDALLVFNSLSMKEPTNGNVYYYRAMVYDALKKYPIAIADYKLAVKYKTDNLAYSYYALAVDYDTLKNHVEAKKYYRLFLDSSQGESNEYVKYAKTRLKQI